MPASPYQLHDLTALILAGGQARRMGGNDKGLVPFRHQPMIQHVLNRVEPRIETIIINANRNQETYRRFGHPVICDQLADYQGPLAGIASGLAHCTTPLLLVLPCDTPNLPDDLLERLLNVLNRENSEIAVAHDGERLQPVIALLRRELLASLDAYLASGERKIDRWYQQHHWSTVDFSDDPAAFVNINCLEEKDRLERYEDSE